MDEVFLTIKGERHYLWRAVDQVGNVLDILVQRGRDKKAAKKFLRKLLKGLTYVPRVIITDKLKSYGAAKREILPGVEHRQHRYLNNCAENSHQPTRQREQRMQRFKSPGHAQRFLFALYIINVIKNFFENSERRKFHENLCAVVGISLVGDSFHETAAGVEFPACVQSHAGSGVEGSRIWRATLSL